jgi:hypothetical protein
MAYFIDYFNAFTTEEGIKTYVQGNVGILVEFEM